MFWDRSEWKINQYSTGRQFPGESKDPGDLKPIKIASQLINDYTALSHTQNNW